MREAKEIMNDFKVCCGQRDRDIILLSVLLDIRELLILQKKESLSELKKAMKGAS